MMQLLIIYYKFVVQDVTREVYAHKDLQEYLVLKFQESASLKNNLKYYEAGNDQMVSKLGSCPKSNELLTKSGCSKKY